MHIRIAKPLIMLLHCSFHPEDVLISVALARDNILPLTLDFKQVCMIPEDGFEGPVSLTASTDTLLESGTR
jgi:hypothetical protein